MPWALCSCNFTRYITIFMQFCTNPNVFFELGKLIAKLLANIDNLSIDNLHPFASIIVSYTLLYSLLLSLFYLLDNSYVGLLGRLSVALYSGQITLADFLWQFWFRFRLYRHCFFQENILRKYINSQTFEFRVFVN